MRMETCTSLNDSCLLQCSVDDIIAMSNTRAAIGGGGMLVNDYEILLGFFEKNFDVKDQWRLEENIIQID